MRLGIDPVVLPSAARDLAVPRGADRATDDAKLRAAARQLEGVFTQQLFKAMRETVPQDQGVFGGGSGEEMFTGLLDERLASDPRAAPTHGIGEAIYQHLLRARGTHGGASGNAAPNAPAPPSVTAADRGTSLATTPRPARP